MRQCEILGRALLLALSLGLMTAPVQGEGAALPSNIGYVDVNTLLQNFEEYKQQNEGYKEFVRTRLIRRNQRVYLADGEWKELDELQAKDAAKLTGQEKARIEELAGLSQTRDRELTDLRGLREPTPEQEKRRKELTERVKQNAKRIDELNAQFEKEVAEKEKALLDDLKERIRAAVERVSKEKGLVLVLEKALILYGIEALDITQDVLARLNKPAA